MELPASVHHGFPYLTILASVLALGLFLAATASVAMWKPGPDRFPATIESP